MNRLTFKAGEFNAFSDRNLSTYGGMQKDGSVIYIGGVADKLAEYEDLEEQGKLLKLPCKPEDKLYWISDQDEDAEFAYEPIEEVEICNIDYNGYSLQLWFADKGAKEFPVLAVSSIGKELFYTKEAAEAALKEMSKE